MSTTEDGTHTHMALEQENRKCTLCRVITQDCTLTDRPATSVGLPVHGTKLLLEFLLRTTDKIYEVHRGTYNSP